MTVFGRYFDPTDAQPTIGERIGNVVTAPARWVGDALGSVIGSVGGGMVNAVSTPLLIAFGMLLVAIVLVMR